MLKHRQVSNHAAAPELGRARTSDLNDYRVAGHLAFHLVPPSGNEILRHHFGTAGRSQRDHRQPSRNVQLQSDDC